MKCIWFSRRLFKILGKSIVFIFLTIVFPTTSLACIPLYPINSKRVPKEIQESADSVFQIRMADGLNFEELSREAYDRSTEGEIFVYDSIWWQKTFCRNSLNPFCVISYKHSIGSAFLYEKNDVLITGLHVISGYLAAALRAGDKLNKPLKEQIDFLKGIKIPIFLSHPNAPWSPHEALVNYATVQEITSTISVDEFHSTKFDMRGSSLISRYVPHDLVILKTDVPINAKPLIRSNKVFPGQQVYAVGTPTSPFVQWQLECDKQDSAGAKKSASAGIEMVSEVELLQKSNLILTTAHTERGMSGGPLLDDEGNVLGVIAFRLGEKKSLSVKIR